MLDAVHNRLTRLATWPAVAVLVVVFIACQQGFTWRQHALGPDMATPDARFGYTPGEIRDLFESWGPERRVLYARTEVTLDVVFPLTYGGLFGALAARLFRRGPWRWAVMVPVVTATADLAENGTLAVLAWQYDGQESPAVWAAAGFTVLKVVGFVLSLLLLLGGGAFGRCCGAARPGTAPDPAV